MAPLIVFVLALVVFAGIGKAGFGPLRGWRNAFRHAFALMFLFTAVAHFGPQRADLIRIVPPLVPRPDLVVTATGVLEILGAIGLMIPRTARLAAGALFVLLIAMFPANVYQAMHGLTITGSPATPLPVRTAIQLVWLAGLGVLAWMPRAERQSAISF